MTNIKLAYVFLIIKAKISLNFQFGGITWFYWWYPFLITFLCHNRVLSSENVSKEH